MSVQTSSHPISWYSASVSQKTTSHRFGKKLAAARKVKNLSQAELGKLMGVSRGMIAYYESSAKNPTIEIIENVGKALGVKISSLIDDAEPRQRGPKSKIEKLTDRLGELPRSKQKAVIEMLEGYLEKTTSA